MGWEKPRCQRFLSWYKGPGSPPHNLGVQFLFKTQDKLKNVHYFYSFTCINLMLREEVNVFFKTYIPIMLCMVKIKD